MSADRYSAVCWNSTAADTAAPDILFFAFFHQLINAAADLMPFSCTIIFNSKEAPDYVSIFYTNSGILHYFFDHVHLQSLSCKQAPG